MTDVMVKVTGGRAEIAQINQGGTVLDALKYLGYEENSYAVKVNGNPADYNTVVSEGQLINLSEKVKGGSL